MTQPFGNFHAIPLNLGKTKELCSDTGQQTSLPIASMQQNPEQLGRYRTRPLPPRLLPLRTCGFCKLLMRLAPECCRGEVRPDPLQGSPAWPPPPPQLPHAAIGSTACRERVCKHA